MKLRNRSLWGAIASSAVACFVVAGAAVVTPSEGASARRGDASAAFVQPFPRSAVLGAYTMTPWDEYHYAIPYAAAAVQYAAYRVMERYGRTANPMEVCDISTIEGVTPAERHPGRAHHGGINFDITYYETRSLSDHIVCPSRADEHCTGPASYLDAERQAYFFAVLSELDLTYDRGLMERMAVDGRVRLAVLPELDRLAQSGEFPRATISRARELVYGELQDGRTGWFRYHHNHTHLRFYWNESRAPRMEAGIKAGIGRILARLSSPGGTTTSRGD